MLYSNVAVASAHLTVDTTWCMDLHQRWSACKFKLQLVVQWSAIESAGNQLQAFQKHWSLKEVSIDSLTAPCCSSCLPKLAVSFALQHPTKLLSATEVELCRSDAHIA